MFRAGIETVHPSQRMAARSLGLTYGQSMRRVVLPQAVRRVTPPLLNDFVALQKDVGLISVLGAVDAVRAAQIEVARTYDFTPYLVAGLLFILLAVPTVRLADWVNLRAARRQQAGGVAVSIPITTPVLEAERLVKRFGDNLVLGGVDLAVAEHEVVVLIGASGSGKSTLLRCVSLLEQLDDGTVRLDGEEVTDPRADADRLRSRFGVVFQAFNLFPHLTVLQNVTLAPRVVHGVSRDEAEERAHAAARAGRPGRPGQGLPGPALRAASSSGWRSSGRWPTSRGCCCSTR